jgi:quinol monooxygenase YgiN
MLKATSGFVACLALVGCSATKDFRGHNMQSTPSQFVTATYQVAPNRQADFLKLLHGCEATMRSEDLITERPVIRMRSEVDPTMLVEILEWVDATAFDRAQENPLVLAWWGKYEALWERGGFGMGEVPESHQPWAQYQALD